MDAPISLKPSESEMKSLISAIDNALRLEPCGADAFGAPSKKNATGTCRIWEICCNRLAPMRLAPLSYFCTCWKVRPSAAPSFSWLIASIMRRIRTRLPTCRSMGSGAFFRGNGKRTAMAAFLALGCPPITRFLSRCGLTAPYLATCAQEDFCLQQYRQEGHCQ